MQTKFEYVARFRALFSGLDTAYGTGEGRWIKRPPRSEDYLRHLEGKGPGIGIGPLRPNNTVKFAAIDLDEPDFEAARAMQKFIPGTSFIERSRSGNAHVWVFFSGPIEAWVPMGILKMATEAAGKAHVEVFPKNHDFAMVSLGNYINLPYHGDDRPIIASSWEDHSEGWDPTGVELECEWPLDVFLTDAERTLNDPEEWRKKARWLLIEKPKPRNESNFGAAPHLHLCAKRIIEDDVVVGDGHRSGVFFMLAKCLSNWSEVDHDEALELLQEVNERTEPPLPDSEIERILGNAERGRYTSTGCSDPVVQPYAHPDCKIAKS